MKKLDTELLEDLAGWLQTIRKQAATTLHLRQSPIDKHLLTWTLPANGEGDGAPMNDIATVLLEAATRHARSQALPDVGFTVFAFIGPDTDKPVNSYPFRCGGNSSVKSSILGDLESPSATGLLGMLMRHTESMHKTQSDGTSEREAAYRQQIADLMAKNERLQDRVDNEAARRLEIVALAEDLTRDKFTRDLQERRFALDKKKTEFLETQLSSLFPVLLNRVTGGGRGKGAPMMGELLLMKFLASLTPDQVSTAISGLDLKPEQVALFGELYSSYGEKYASQKKKQHQEQSVGDTNGAAKGDGPAS